MAGETSAVTGGPCQAHESLPWEDADWLLAFPTTLSQAPLTSLEPLNQAPTHNRDKIPGQPWPLSPPGSLLWPRLFQPKPPDLGAPPFKLMKVCALRFIEEINKNCWKRSWKGYDCSLIHKVAPGHQRPGNPALSLDVCSAHPPAPPCPLWEPFQEHPLTEPVWRPWSGVGVWTSGRSLSQLEGAAGGWVVIMPCGNPDKPPREVGGLPPPQPPWETPQGVNLRNSGDKLHSL